MQRTEVGISGQVAIVRHFADIDFVSDGRVSAIEKTIIRPLVGFIVDGGGFSR